MRGWSSATRRRMAYDVNAGCWALRGTLPREVSTRMGAGDPRHSVGVRRWRTIALVALLMCGFLVVAESSSPVLAASGAITEFTVPITGSDPLGITTGPDGNLWITDSNDFDPRKVEKV